MGTRWSGRARRAAGLEGARGLTGSERAGRAGADASAAVLAVERGCGIGAGRDGIVKGTVWASYLHLHALGTPRWADGFLGLASRFAAERAGTAVAGV